MLVVEIQFLLLVLVAALGASAGSFLGSLNYRLPKKYIRKWHEEEDLGELGVEIAEDPEVVNSPRSLCVHCKKKLEWWELIPIFSFILLRGRCSECKGKISPQYFVMEGLMLLLTVFFYLKFGLNAEFIILVILSAIFLLAAGIDLQTFILPDFLTIPVIVSGLLVTLLQFTLGIKLNPPFATSVQDSVLGLILIPTFLILFTWLFKVVTKKEGFGFGDIKLLAGVGVWFGLFGVFATLLLSCFLGIAGQILVSLLTKRKIFGVHYPFGPYIVAGLFVYLFVFDFLASG